ncbi:MAG: FAD-dependent oxidoreductase [Acidimicrobiales bacterium]
MGHRALRRKAPRVYRASDIESTEPLVDTSTAKGGIRYADAYLPDNDARFVWGFVRSALDLGATAVNYVSVDRADRHDDRWTVSLTDTESGSPLRAAATAIVNAARPLHRRPQRAARPPHRAPHRLLQGIHLIVPKLTDSDRILAFFDDTGRLFYVIPMANRSVVHHRHPHRQPAEASSTPTVTSSSSRSTLASISTPHSLAATSSPSAVGSVPWS